MGMVARKPKRAASAPSIYIYDVKVARIILKWTNRGAWVVQSVERPNFSSGHDLTVREFEPCVRLCADSSEPGACFRFCVSLSLSDPPLFMLCLSLSQK